MKMSDVRPCDACKGPIVPLFYVLRISMAMFMAKAANQVMGMTQMFGGLRNRGALAIAEAMSPEPEVVKILGDEEKDLMTEIFICQECFSMKDLSLAQLMEAAAAKRAREDNG